MLMVGGCCCCCMSALLQFGDQEGVRGVFVALLELLKQKVSRASSIHAESGPGSGVHSAVSYSVSYSVQRCCGVRHQQWRLQLGVLSCVAPTGWHHPRCASAGERCGHSQHLARFPCWAPAGPARGRPALPGESR
jgi:hypothetical protein